MSLLPEARGWDSAVCRCMAADVGQGLLTKCGADLLVAMCLHSAEPATLCHPPSKGVRAPFLSVPTQ